MEEILGALELGVVPIGSDVDAALASLSSEESRKARRKFRKIWRKWVRRHSGRGNFASGVHNVRPVTRRHLVAMECKAKGKEIICTR
tara:strand:+ start:208 stop:468 length:261 start_codon:yes stop_codon:yes gene_type:complete